MPHVAARAPLRRAERHVGEHARLKRPLRPRLPLLLVVGSGGGGGGGGGATQRQVARWQPLVAGDGRLAGGHRSQLHHASDERVQPRPERVVDAEVVLVVGEPQLEQRVAAQLREPAVQPLRREVELWV